MRLVGVVVLAFGLAGEASGACNWSQECSADNQVWVACGKLLLKQQGNPAAYGLTCRTIGGAVTPTPAPQPTPAPPAPTPIPTILPTPGPVVTPVPADTSTCGRNSAGGWVSGVWLDFVRKGGTAFECVELDQTHRFTIHTVYPGAKP